jgi:elongation factor Ts
MANITAADVKRLREATGAGMMDCKTALESSGGDLTKAVEYLRVKGQAGVSKRKDRATSNGLVTAHVADGVGILLEINCETDFVAKGEAFQALGARVLAEASSSAANDVQTLLGVEVEPGRSLQEVVDEAAATIGEKILVRRLARIEAPVVTSYLHRTNPDLPPQIGVLLGTDAPGDVARDIAMHIAALEPDYLARADVPEDVVTSERRIAESRSREEGKPEAALPKIVEGRVNAFFKEKVLLEQRFARDEKRSVQQVLADAGITATAFARFRVGA